MKLSFVIPCYNSEKTIKTVVDEIVSQSELLSHDFEIILVNDFSKDGTLTVIKDLCAQNRRIIGLNLSQNFGQPSATMAGFSIASGDLIVYSDDDGQTPIDEVGKLIQKIEDGYDVVFAEFSEKKNSLFQNLGTHLNNMMASYLMSKPKDIRNMGNFWACKRYVINEILKCKNPYPYLIGIVLGITKNMASVPTNHRVRISGKSNYTLSKMISLWLNGFTAFSIKPLRLASLLGFITALIGFMYIVVLIINKLNYPEIPLGYSSIMSAIIFIGGMIMMMLGLIGEYVGRIYININNKPQFIIRDSYNCDSLF